MATVQYNQNVDGFGDTLRRVRQAHSISQRKLGLKYGWLQHKPDGVAPSNIAQWESGARFPSRDAIALLASAMGATETERQELYLSAGFVPEGYDFPAGYEQPRHATQIVELGLRGAEDLPDYAKRQIVDFVRKVELKHCKQAQEEEQSKQSGKEEGKEKGAS